MTPVVAERIEDVKESAFGSIYTKSYDINYDDPNLIKTKYVDGYVVMPAAWWEDDDEEDEW